MGTKAPPHTLVIALEDLAASSVSDGWRVTIYAPGHDGEPATLCVDEWRGLEADLLGTLYSDVLHAFLYGQGLRDIRGSITATRRLARAHARRYSRA